MDAFQLAKKLEAEGMACGGPAGARPGAAVSSQQCVREACSQVAAAAGQSMVSCSHSDLTEAFLALILKAASNTPEKQENMAGQQTVPWLYPATRGKQGGLFGKVERGHHLAQTLVPLGSF